LTLDVSQVVGHGEGAESVVKLVGFFSSTLNGIIEFFLIEVGIISLGEAESND
jgi:hypothetical protein